jgi:spermidine/putrescine transport system permease protein
MSPLARTYGRGAAVLCWTMVAGWLLLLVLFPQALMVVQSLWRWEQPKAASELTIEIDRGYNDLSVLRLDRQAATGAVAADLDGKIAELETRLREMESGEVKPVKVWGLQNYTRMSETHVAIFAKTLLSAAIVTLLALIVCYPVAWAAATAKREWVTAALLFALTIPYAINELLRIYAWMMILDYKGVLNTILDWLGLLDLSKNQGIPFLESQASVFAGLVYTYILFMVFPLFNAMQSLDRSQIEAARGLGANTLRIHRRIVIPHARPGMAVGCIMVFMLAAGSFAVPRILSRGLGGDWFTTLIYRQFFEAENWNIGSAYAVVLLVVCLAIVGAAMRLTGVSVRDMIR